MGSAGNTTGSDGDVQGSEWAMEHQQIMLFMGLNGQSDQKGDGYNTRMAFGGTSSQWAAVSSAIGAQSNLVGGVMLGTVATGVTVGSGVAAASPAAAAEIGDLVEVGGFKFPSNYYSELWSEGRPATTLAVQEVLDTATSVVKDNLPGLYYICREPNDWSANKRSL